MPLKVSHHKVVYVTYNIQTPEGEILEASDIPIGYIQGSHKGLFLKIEKALLGCQVGERVRVELSASKAFGEHKSELTFTDKIDHVPPQFRRVGAEVEFENQQGESKKFVVSKVTATHVTLDANHPFAGKDVVFYVTVTDIRDATVAEIQMGEPMNMPASTLH